MNTKKSTETILAAFTDHLAVVVHMLLPTNAINRGKTYWRMNTSYLHNPHIKDIFKQQCTMWSRSKTHYHYSVLRWTRLVKAESVFYSVASAQRGEKIEIPWKTYTILPYATC
jgi:N-glycosylase/DNA lyase